jgi:hypothetical protein
MEESTILITLAVSILLGYIILYADGRKYLETFDGQHSRPPHNQAQEKPKELSLHQKAYMPQEGQERHYEEEPNYETPAPFRQRGSKPPEKPYATDRIESVDEYDLAAVYQNQGSKLASKKQISDAMTRYPMDWATQGPNSQYFQENQAQYEKDTAGQTQPSPFHEETHGPNMTLPDSEQQEEEEKKILQTYKPSSSKGLLEYSIHDVKHLLDKVYRKKGLIPVIRKSKQGPNVWEVIEVKEKHPKIVWEDEVDTTRDAMRKRGEEVIEVPMAASDLAAGLDPFFTARNPTRTQKQEYTEFTPGLERMFAPTHPVKSWF